METPSPSSAMKLKMKEGGKGTTQPTPSPTSQNINVTISIQGEKEEQFKEGKKSSDHSQLGQCLRAAVLGANDGLVTTASLMLGVGAMKEDSKIMVISGLVALVAGACSMAIGEFVSVQTQRDAEISTLKSNKITKAGISIQKFDPSTPSAEKKAGSPVSISSTEREALSNPLKAACASALAFSVGSLVPLISTAFIENFAARVGVLAGVSSLALVTFGAAGAFFSGASLVKGGLRVLIGGWISISITYGLLKVFHHSEAGDDP